MSTTDYLAVARKRRPSVHKAARARLQARLEYLFDEGERSARKAVAEALGAAAKANTLDASGLAIPISSAIESAGATALQLALSSFDRTVGRSASLRDALAEPLYGAVDRYFITTANLGKAGLPFGGERNRLIDAFNEQAEHRMRAAVDQHLQGWNDPALRWHERHPKLYDGIKMVAACALGVVGAVIKLKFFPG